jgi:Eco57I restriction-modification methylase
MFDRRGIDRVALKAFSGSLASLELIAALGRSGRPKTGLRARLASALAVLGPASGARQVFDRLAAPLLTAAGATISIEESDAAFVSAAVPATGQPVAILAAAGWNGDLRRLRRLTARHDSPARWWIGTNGTTIRILDVTRAYAQRTIDVDIEMAAADDTALVAIERLIDFASPDGPTELAAIVDNSERHRADVGRSLQWGVEQALVGLVGGFAGPIAAAAALDAALADALTVVYRVLFLLFAEARGLVPQWHPIYRDSYTIESLRPIAEGHGTPAGLWEALQAIARLAHRGCTAGTLRVVPFNGRLFAPSAAPLAEARSLDDAVVRDVLLAVTTRPGAGRRERISYEDLGVEQLGSVYERVLEYTPSRVGAAIVMAPTGRRKRTGTFYTPRAMTEYVVRRALAPLVREATPERILSLRVVDPSMGSGAFLVAACRYLGAAYEEALIREGTLTRADVSPADRADFRRTIAQRCLFGVDANPTAVQLARLSLWLCTLAADRPLTFLDHRLRCGNSLVGATIADMTSRPPSRRPRPARKTRQLGLFDERELAHGVSAAVGVRLGIASQPDASAAIVRDKERTLEELDGSAGPLRGWRELADAWCAAWFWPGDVAPPVGTAWTTFAAALRGRSRDLPPDVERRWRETAAAVAARERFFHWELEYPEVFHDERGAPQAGAGFDAVIGNPPWSAAGSVTRFSRDSGCYRMQGDGHVNLYQLFAERMLRLLRPGGRAGMVLPAGLLSDVGCADLRRYLFDGCDVDAAISLDNRDGLFPIHRSVRFVLLTATAGGKTEELCVKRGVRDAAALDDVADLGPPPGAVRIPMSMVRAFGGSGRAVPDLATDLDRAVLARLLSCGPPLESADGWNLRFGRELNATDDRRYFGAAGLPVLEGKMLEPFRVRVEDATVFVDRRVAARLLERRGSIDRPRLGYREVASATNRLTLIAAIIPAGAVTTHTIFCLREALDEERQWFLCGVFNSYAANYWIRLRGGTHVPASVIHTLPVPMPGDDDRRAIASLARRLSEGPRPAAAAVLQASVARLYGLTREEFAHVLSTFPLIDPDERAAALRAAGSAL